MTSENRIDDGRPVPGEYDVGARSVALSDGRYAWEVPVSAVVTLDDLVSLAGFGGRDRKGQVGVSADR